MDADRQREIASKGGKAVSQDRAHMSAIGRKGGESSRGTRVRAAVDLTPQAVGAATLEPPLA